MVTSLDIADAGARDAVRLLRGAPRAADVPGLRSSLALACAPLSEAVLPRPGLGRVALLCAWDDDAALRRHLAASGPWADGVGEVRSVRLRPTRLVGAWPEFGEIAPEPGDPGPVAVLTLGRLRPSRVPAFLRASAAAERDALASPALTFATGMARPPRVVATFSLWRDAEAMRGYVDRAGGGHRAAVAQHGAKPFHSRSAFIRFAAYDAAGPWASGRRDDPLDPGR